MGKTKIILTEEVLGSIDALKALLAENPDSVAAEIIEITNAAKLQFEQLEALQKENESNLEKIASLESELEEVKAESAVYEQTNIELSKQLSEKADLKLVQDGKEKDTPKFEEKTFELDGVTYGFNYPKTTINRTPVDVDHVIADPELQQKLISMKSGMIKVIEK